MGVYEFFSFSFRHKKSFNFQNIKTNFKATYCFPGSIHTVIPYVGIDL